MQFTVVISYRQCFSSAAIFFWWELITWLIPGVITQSLKKCPYKIKKTCISFFLLRVSWVKCCLVFPQIDLMPHDVITQLLRVLAIETKQEKAIINAEPADVALSGLEAFSFDYIVKWPLSLIINRFLFALFLISSHLSAIALFIYNKVQLLLNVLQEMQLTYLLWEHFFFIPLQSC